MKAQDILRIGDVVYFNYGCMCGEDFGTVIGFERTAWGTSAWVRLSDFSRTTVETLNGTVWAKPYTNYQGDTFLSARPLTGQGIGSYLVVAHGS